MTSSPLTLTGQIHPARQLSAPTVRFLTGYLP
jgi:hypothetical protein